MASHSSGNRLLLASIPVLNLVAQRDEELDVEPGRVVRPRPAMGDALGKLPALRLAVHRDHEPWPVFAVVTEVDAVTGQLGLKQVQPRQMHVDNEALE